MTGWIDPWTNTRQDLLEEWLSGGQQKRNLWLKQHWFGKEAHDGLLNLGKDSLKWRLRRPDARKRQNIKAHILKIKFKDLIKK